MKKTVFLLILSVTVFSLSSCVDHFKFYPQNRYNSSLGIGVKQQLLKDYALYQDCSFDTTGDREKFFSRKFFGPCFESLVSNKQNIVGQILENCKSSGNVINCQKEFTCSLLMKYITDTINQKDIEYAECLQEHSFPIETTVVALNPSKKRECLVSPVPVAIASYVLLRKSDDKNKIIESYKWIKTAYIKSMSPFLLHIQKISEAYFDAKKGHISTAAEKLKTIIKEANNIEDIIVSTEDSRFIRAFVQFEAVKDLKRLNALDKNDPEISKAIANINEFEIFKEVFHG